MIDIVSVEGSGGDIFWTFESYGDMCGMNFLCIEDAIDFVVGCDMPFTVSGIKYRATETGYIRVVK